MLGAAQSRVIGKLRTNHREYCHSQTTRGNPQSRSGARDPVSVNASVAAMYSDRTEVMGVTITSWKVCACYFPCVNDLEGRAKGTPCYILGKCSQRSLQVKIPWESFATLECPWIHDLNVMIY